MAIERSMYLPQIENPQALDGETVEEEFVLGDDLTPAQEGDIEFIQEGDDLIPVDADLIGEEETDPLAEFDVNLAEYMDEEDLENFSTELLELVKEDRESTKEWSDIAEKGINLLGFKIEELTEPFPGACGASHPLLAEAIISYQSKARSRLLPPKGPVRTQIYGKKTVEKQQQANRVQQFMNYQVMHTMTEYKAEHDRMLFSQAFSGSAFTKIYFDPALNRPCSKFVPHKDFIVDYHATNLDAAERYTHVLHLSENDVARYKSIGMYRDVDISYGDKGQDSDPTQSTIDELHGRRRPNHSADSGPCTLYEIHTNLFIADDPLVDAGVMFKVPYIITIDVDSGKVLSIYRNWKKDSPTYEKILWFVHWPFIPGFGFYGYGYVHLIGGLAKTATTNLRQLVDAGSFANMQGGFKAHGLRVVGNNKEPLAPGEWRDVNAVGVDLGKALLPLPYKEPSQTLYHLLGFISQTAMHFADATDQVVSEATNYGPVGTTMALLEASGRMFTAIHERLFDSQKSEFDILARINREYYTTEYPYEIVGEEGRIISEDFNESIDIIPVADPRYPSEAQRVARSNAMISIASQTMDQHNMREVLMETYDALGYDDPERFLIELPPEAKPLDPVSENAISLANQGLKVGDWQDHGAHIKVHMAFITDPMYSQNPNAVVLLNAHIQEHLAHKIRKDMEAAMGAELPPLGEEMDPELEVDISRRAANAADEIKARNAAEMEADMEADMLNDPAFRIQLEELALQAQKIEVQREKIRVDAQMKREELDTRKEIAELKEEVRLVIEGMRQKNKSD